MSAYDFKQIPELTEEEKKSPYAPFYYKPVPPLAPETAAALQPGQPMDPTLALAPQDWLALFMPGTLKAVNGYCQLPDGTGFSITRTRLPGVTAEMENWWREWIKSEEYGYLNYKIWLPGYHIMLTNPIWTDLGWGHVNFQKVSELSFLDGSVLPKELNPDFYDIYGGSYTLVPDYVGKPYWAAVLHYVTMDARGEEITTCVWSGLHVYDGLPVRMIDRAEKVNPEYVRLFACHYAWESARKADLLPALYAHGRKLAAV